MKPSIYESYTRPITDLDYAATCGRMGAMLHNVAFSAIFALAWEVYKDIPDSDASDKLGEIAENAIAGLPADSGDRRSLLRLIYGKPLYG